MEMETQTRTARKTITFHNVHNINTHKQCVCITLFEFMKFVKYYFVVQSRVCFHIL